MCKNFSNQDLLSYSCCQLIFLMLQVDMPHVFIFLNNGIIWNFIFGNIVLKIVNEI